MSKGYKQWSGSVNHELGHEIEVSRSIGLPLYNNGENKEIIEAHKKEVIAETLELIESYLLERLNVQEKYPKDDIQEFIIHTDVILVNKK